MSTLAIIPARGGSKRIPRKNIKNFLDKPIIAYSIETAIKSKLFDEIMVSTDDAEIAEISKSYGASIPFMRSVETSNDYATTIEVINEVLHMYTHKGIQFDYVCCIYPTAPLMQEKDLLAGYQKLKADSFSLVYPVVHFTYPVWRAIEVNTKGECKMLWPEYENTRSQDLKPVYHDAGQWYWFNTKEIKSPQKTGAIILTEERVQDIDTISDWQQAEIKFRLLKNNIS